VDWTIIHRYHYGSFGIALDIYQVQVKSSEVESPTPQVQLSSSNSIMGLFYVLSIDPSARKETHFECFPIQFIVSAVLFHQRTDNFVDNGIVVALKVLEVFVRFIPHFNNTIAS